ncbi:MAG: choice-of-anchor C family protein [Pseudomonadota bacterium]
MARTDARVELNTKLEIVLESAPEGVLIPQANLLFKAEFERAGPDLLLVNEGQPTVRIVDYFSTANPPTLRSPEGNEIEGRIVEILAGPPFPGQVAQGAPGLAGAAGAEAIGQVEAVSGTATVQRSDGTVEPLTITTKVFQNDVVSTGDGASISITFEDGTIFTLAANSRMVLDEMIYDPSANDNSVVFNLIEGSFVFIAGQVAKTGGMEVKTPAATMGIRGTTVKIDIVTENGVTRVEVSLNEDPDGTTGQFTITRLDGTVVADVVATETKWIISPVEGETREVPRTLDDLNADQIVLSQAFSAFESANLRVTQGGEFVETDAGGAPQDPNDNNDQLPDPNAPDPDDPDQRGDLGSSGLGTEVASDTLEGATSTTGSEDISELGGEGVDALGVSGSTSSDLEGNPLEQPSEEREAGAGNEEDQVAAEETEDEAGAPPLNAEPVENTSPIITISAGSFTVPEDGSVVLNGFQINDDGSSVLTATLIAGSTVTLPSGATVTIIEGTGTNDERLVIQGTAEQVTNALNGLIYAPTPNADDQGTLSIEINDGTFGTSAQLVIDILALPDAPIAVPDDAAGNAANGTITGDLIGNDADPDITPTPDVLEVVQIQDDDETAVIPSGGSATITLNGGGTITVNSNGSYSFDPGSAYDSLSDGQSVVETVTYLLTDNTLDDNGDPRTATSTISITIEGSSDGPALAGDGETIGNDGTAFDITTSDLTAIDPDTADGDLTYTITTGPTQGIVSLASAPGIAITSFTQAQLAAGDVIYEHGSERGTSDSIAVTVTDGEQSASTTLTITASDVNDDPTGTGFPVSLTRNEDSGGFINFSGVFLDDVDLEGGTLNVLLTSNGADLFAIPGSSGVTVTPVDGNTTNVSGTLAQLNSFFGGGNGFVAYTPPADAEGNAVDTIEIFLNDGGNTGSGGGTDVLVASIQVDTTPVNDAPTLAVSGDTTADFEEGNVGVNLDGTFSISDVDAADTTIDSAVLRITGNFNSGDTLFLPTTPGFTSVFDSGAGTLTINGTATHAQYEALLNTVQFTTNSQNPSTDQRTIRVQVSDGTALGTQAFVSVNVEAVNDAPVVTGLPTSFAVIEDTVTSLDLSNVSVSDVDGDEFSDTVTLTLTTDIGTLSNPTPGSSSPVTVTQVDSQTITFEGTAYDFSFYFSGASVDYTPPANSNATGTITLTADDGGATGTGGPQTGSTDVSFTITPVNDAPVLSNVTGNNAYTEGDGAVIVNNLAEISDIDSTNLQLVQVAIAGNFASGEDFLSASTTGTALAANYQSSTGILTISGTGTVADFEQVLRTVTYENISDNPSNLDRTLSFSATDGIATSTILTRTITVESVNDGPTLSGVPGFFIATEDTTTTFDLTNLVLGDPDAGSSDLTVQLSAANGTFAPSGSTTITVNTTDPSSVTFTGSITELGTYFATNGNIPYTPDANFNGSTTIETRVIDNGNTGDTGGVLFNFFTNTFNVAPVDDSPSLTISSTGPVYGEGSTGIQILGSATINDVDDATITGATISITSGFVAGDELQFDDMDGIFGSYNAATGVLTLTGTDTIAEYQTALSLIEFASTSDAPGSGDRTITFQVTNAQGSNSETQVVQVNDVNDAPSVTFDTTPLLNVTEDTPTAIVPINFDLSDVDSGGTNVALEVTADDGSLAFNNLGSSGLTLLGDTLTGSIADLETYVLGGNIVLTPIANSAGNDRVFFTINDGGNTGSGGALNDTLSIGINLLPVNDAPELTNTTGPTLFAEGDSPAAIDSGLTLSDVDSATISSATVSIGTGFVNGEDFLRFTDQLGITGSYAPTTGILTLTGTATVADYQTALQSVAYENTSAAPDTGDRTIGFTANDGTDTSVLSTKTVQVTAGNDAPTVTTSSGTTAYVENQINLAIDGGLTVADVDDTNLEGATIAITTGFVPLEDVLNFTDQLGITGTYVPSTGILTLTGTASVADYQTALQSVGYTNASQDPSTANRTIEFTVNDGDVNSPIASRVVTVEAVNDPPGFGGVPATLTTNEDTLANVNFTGLNFNDPEADPATDIFTVTIGSNVGTLSVQSAGPGVTINSSDPSNIVFTGTINALNAHFAANGASTFTPNANVNGPGIISVIANDGGASGTGGAQTTQVNTAVTINAIDDAPTVSAAITGTSYTEGGTAVSITNNATITDVDDTQITSATVSISSGFVDGDQLNFSDTPNITGSYNGATGLLTLSGPDTLANYELAIEAITFSSTSDTPGPGNRTLSIQVNNALGSNIATRTIGVSDVNDAPTMSIPTTATVVEDVATTIDLSSIDFSDVDAGTASVSLNITAIDGTITLASGSTSSVGVVSIANGFNLVGAIEDIEDFLQVPGQLTFQGLPNDINGGFIDFLMTDLGNTGGGGAQIANETITVNTTAVNDAPEIETSFITFPVDLIANGSFENGPAGPTDSGVQVNAGDGTIPNWTVDAGSVDHIRTTWSAEDGTGSIDLNGNSAGTLSQTITTIPGSTYELTFYMARNPAGDPTENLNVTIDGTTTPFSFSNGSTTTTNMGWEERSLFFTATGSSTTVTFSSPQAGSSGPAIDDVSVQETIGAFPQTGAAEDTPTFINNIQISDVDADGATLVTLSVLNGTLVVDETVPGGLTSSQVTNNGTGVVSLLGTLTAINTTLGSFEGLAYTGNLNFTGNDTLTIVADDQGDQGQPAQTDTASITIAVSPENDAPTITAPVAAVATEETATVVNFSTLDLADVDAGTADVQLDLTATGGTLALASSSTTDVTVTTISGGFRLVGAVEDIEDFLQVANQVTFTGNVNNVGAGAGNIQLTLNDLGESGAGTALSDTHNIQININGVNDAPTINASIAPTTNEDTPVVLNFVSAAQFQLADVDAGFQNVTLTISATDGEVVLAGSGSVTVVNSGSGGTVTGEISAVRSYVLSNNLTFNPDSEFSGTANVNFSISDNGNTGSGGALTASDGISINVLSVNDAPTLDTTKVTTGEDLVSNGGFEQGPTGGQFTQVNAGSTAIADWTVGLSSVDHYHGTRENAEGIAHLDLNGLGQGSVSQTIVTIPGETYELTFNMSRAPVGFPPDDLRVIVDGNSQDFTYTTAGGTETNMQWEERSLFFTATGSSTAITFQTLEPGNSGPALDNVSVQQVIGASTAIAAVEETPILINNLEFADVDSAGDLTIGLSVTDGVLLVDDDVPGGLIAADISGNGTGSVTLVGTAAEINATLGALEGLTFTPPLNFNSTSTLTVTATDGTTAMVPAVLSINVADVNDAPPATSALGDVVTGNVANIEATQFYDPEGGVLGTAVANIGDINNDGYDDFAIGGPDTTVSSSIVGATSIVLGGTDPNFGATPNGDGEVNLNDIITTTGGFEFVGDAAGDRMGFSIAGGGDVNGDGVSDFVLTEVFDDDSGNINSGKAYIVFGGQNFNSFANASGQISTSLIGAVSGVEGFAIEGSDLNQNLGYSVNIAGDLNFDGVDDILVGAPTATGAVGNAYVIFGGQDFASFTGGDGTIELNQRRIPSTLEGVQFIGENIPDLAGFDMNYIGDFNGDGIDDVAISSLQNSNGGAGSTLGAIHVVYGGQDFSQAGALTGGISGKEIGLNNVGGGGTGDPVGFQVNGTSTGQGVGWSLAGNIDFNNDGIQDLIFADQAVSTRVFVLYGGQAITGTITTADIEAGTFNGVYFTPPGSTRQTDVANGGDINGDGIDDLVIGAKFVDAPSNNSGETFVIYGGQGLTGQVTFDTIGSTTEGFSLTGEFAGSFSGDAVSSAGDVNNDGFDDFLIGAPGNNGTTPGDGAAYLVYGGDFDGRQFQLGTAGNDTITGTSNADTIIGGDGGDLLFGEGGADNLDGGRGNDVLYSDDIAFERMDGGAGSDGLTFTDGGNIDLTAVSNDAIVSIETLSITTPGATSLRLGVDDVFAMSDTGSPGIISGLSGLSPIAALTNSVSIFGNMGDTIFLENGTTGSWVLNTTKSLTLASRDVYEFIEGGSGDVLATLGITDDPGVTVTIV